jgi:hypothetical protein
MTVARLTAPAALLAVVGLVGGPSAAQDNPGKRDPQSTFEPRSAPGAGQQFLAKFVGDWDVVKTFYPRAGKPSVQTGTCKVEMIHGGRFLRSSFILGHGGGKTTGLGLIGFEAASGLFTSVWTDSRATRMSFRRSKDKFDGNQIVLYGAALGEATPKRPSRTVTRLLDGGRRIVHRQYTIGPGGKERIVMDRVLTRKPAR